METDIGPTLREARVRRHVDLIEVERETKIRVRYLRALENEEWDVLPEPTYTRGFIRTYATFLGLDGERLAEDFRRQQEELVAEGPAGREPRGLAPRPTAVGARGPRIGAGAIMALVVVALVGVLIVLGLTGDEGDEPGGGGGGEGAGKPAQGQGQNQSGRPAAVSIRLSARDEVWVCAVNAAGQPVVDGQILAAGTAAGPFRSRRFDLAFGNGSIDLRVGNRPFAVQDSPSPLGYRVTPSSVRPLPEGSRPDCA